MAALVDLNLTVAGSMLLEEMPRLLNLAQPHRLTAYDAAYLDWALRERLPLATLDGELAAAGVAIFSP